MAPLGEWSLEATILVGARGMPGTVASSNSLPGQDIPVVRRPPVRRRPPETGGERVAGQADSAKSRRSRTGWPLRSARERSWRRANVRPRPPSGMTIPAHSPSARGSSHASRAHIHRRGHARQTALASSSADVVHRSGSRVHAPIGGSTHSDAFIVCRSSARSAASHREGAKRSARTVATQQLYMCLNNIGQCRQRA
jgi:hypothetical protein